MNCLTAHSNTTPQFSTGSSCISKRNLGRQNVIIHIAIWTGYWFTLFLLQRPPLEIQQLSASSAASVMTGRWQGTFLALFNLNCKRAEHNLADQGEKESLQEYTQQSKLVLHPSWKTAHQPTDNVTGHLVHTAREERSSHTITNVTSSNTYLSSASFPERKQGALLNPIILVNERARKDFKYLSNTTTGWRK